jgi:hypothetical protein
MPIKNLKIYAIDVTVDDGHVETPSHNTFKTFIPAYTQNDAAEKFDKNRGKILKKSNHDPGTTIIDVRYRVVSVPGYKISISKK